MSAREGTRGALLTGGAAVVQALADEGVELVFGIPGTHNLPVYRHLPESGIRHVTPRHEQGGGYAADGYARASGRPGVLSVTTGPGVTNAATPVATAWADSVPLLVLAPAVPTDVEGRDAGFLHQVKDQRGAMAGLAATSHRASSPGDAYRAIRAAFAGFRSGRPRPAHVEVPLDVLDAEGHVTDPGPGPDGPVPPDQAALERAVALLTQAHTVTFLLGGGARRAHGPLTELAERLGAAVLTTVNGKGCVAESHPLSLGASVRLPAAKSWLGQSDVVLAIGTELGESDLWGPPPRFAGRVIRVDVDAAQLDKNVEAAVGIAGDSHAVATALLRQIGGAPARRRPDLRAVRELIEHEARRDGREWTDLCAALQQALGRDGLLAADSAMATYYGAVHLLRFDSPGRLVYPTGSATLGYGLPAGIGAKLARPDAPVIVLSGDGGLLFTVAELVTAAELRLSLPIVVPNNNGYGEIRRQMVAAGIEPVGVDLATPDLPALAIACGGRGERLRDVGQLPAALGRAFDHDGPTLIELPWRRP